MRLRHRVPLIGVHPDAQGTRLTGHLDQSTVTGLASSTKDHISTLIQGLTGRSSTPLRVGKRHIQTTRVIRLDHLDVRVDVLGAVDVPLTEGHHRRH